MLLTAPPCMLPAAEIRAHPLGGSTETGISQPAVAPCTAVCASAQNAPSDMTAAARFSEANCSAVASSAICGNAASLPAAHISVRFSLQVSLLQLHSCTTGRAEGHNLRDGDQIDHLLMIDRCDQVARMCGLGVERMARVAPWRRAC